MRVGVSRSRQSRAKVTPFLRVSVNTNNNVFSFFLVSKYLVSLTAPARFDEKDLFYFYFFYS